MTREEAMLCRVIVYLLNNNRGKFNYTYNKLKYLVIIYLEKHRRFIGGGAIHFNEDTFKLLLYKLESIDYINISKEILMNQFVTTNIRVRDEEYDMNELALLNMVIKEYGDKSVLVLNELANREKKINKRKKVS